MVEWNKTRPIESQFTNEEERIFATKSAYRLKPEVIKWLEENVKDRRDKQHPKGWCVGSDSYLFRGRHGSSIDIFFERRSDAFAFIKQWSVYKKPTTYFDYFRDIRKALNLETNKLVKVDDLPLF